MKEVKTPRKPFIYYYLLVFSILILFNLIAMPWIAQRQIKEVDYGTFMTMTEKKDIDTVEIQSNKILFSDVDGKIYETGKVDDDNLINRLYESEVKFSSQIIEQTSPMMNILLYWILPFILFSSVGNRFLKKSMDNSSGAKGSMMFGLGKSNAKVYVKSSEGIKF